MTFSDRRRAVGLASMLAALALPALATAQGALGIPGCYAPAKVSAPATAPELELFVLIDQTTQLDPTLAASLQDNALRLVRPGSAFRVIQFSAFNQGRYMSTVGGGWLEPLLPKATRDTIGVNTLAKLDNCLAAQLSYGRRLAASAIGLSAGGSSPQLSRSDIIASLGEASRLVSSSRARTKIVLVASDMLENSTISSFYAHGSIRRINADSELAAVASRGLLGDFAGARVYILGAGLLAARPAGSAEADQSNLAYRDPVTMANLRSFWSGYFTKSHAQLIAFGQPALLEPVR